MTDSSRVRYSALGAVGLYLLALVVATGALSLWLFIVELPPGIRLTRPSAAFVVAMCLALAVALSVLKRQQQLWYGVAELAVAIVGAWRSLSVVSAEPTTRALVVGGAVYVMSRGVNNIVEARVKAREKKRAATAAAPTMLP